MSDPEDRVHLVATELVSQLGLVEGAKTAERFATECEQDMNRSFWLDVAKHIRTVMGEQR